VSVIEIGGFENKGFLRGLELIDGMIIGICIYNFNDILNKRKRKINVVQCLDFKIHCQK